MPLSNKMFGFNKNRKPIVAVSMAPTRSPWGGASPFVLQFEAIMQRRGWRVQYSLQPTPDVVLVIDPRMDHPKKKFGLEELRVFRKAHPQVPILHRINECDQRKGTNDIDELLRQTSEISDYTVFIAEWLRDYFASKWFDISRPHSCIYNGADPAFYHPFGTKLPTPGEPLRIVTHHWSDNPLKGFDVYEKLDSQIADGKLPGFFLRVIGRWPKSIAWKSAELFGPLTGRPLADKLRECHIYLTASRWEPCGMHHVEGAQCGLPLVYHEDGGGIVEAGKKYGVGYRDDPSAALREVGERLPEFRKKVLANMPSGDRMAMDYADVCRQLVGFGN
jgi:glycosyltransferase involved in cell wall biosynthesis